MTSGTDSVDWRDPWPVVGVKQEPPASTPAVDRLYADGYRAVFTVDSITTDVDQHQAHLNNIAAVRIFSELRIAYVASRLAPDWPRHLRTEKLIVVVTRTPCGLSERSVAPRNLYWRYSFGLSAGQVSTNRTSVS